MSAQERGEIIIRKLLREACQFADLIEQGKCPECHGALEIVYDGSSGSELWCVTAGCNVSLHSTPDGDYRFGRAAPTNWFGEDA